MRIGFHVSISGGFARSIERASELGCTCIQLFSRNPRGWTVNPLDKADVAEFKKLGVNALLQKPFTQEELVAALTNIVWS